MNQDSMKFVECRGTPRERGLCMGEAAREEIQHNVNFFKPFFVPDRAPLAPHYARFCPEILEEASAVAESADVPLELLLRMNHWELPEAERCTVIAVNSESGVLIAKNNDSPADEDCRFLIRHIVPDDGIPVIQVGYAGSFSGLDAVNAAGLSNAHGSVGSRFARPGMRLDIRLRFWQLMQRCATVDELLRELRKVPLTGKGFSIALGDANGDSCFLEAAVPRLEVRDCRRAFAYSTNLYELPELAEADARPPGRRDVCLKRRAHLRRVAENAPPCDVAGIQKLLSGHEPWAPCRHGGVQLSVTDWSFIARPGEKDALIAHGAPCGAPYRRYGF